MSRSSVWLLIFLTVFGAEILVVTLPWDAGEVFIKPLIIPAIAGFSSSAGAFKIARPAKVLQTALFFAWVGDVLLMFQGRSDFFFIGGLCSFLLMHVLYTVVFLNTKNNAIWPTPWESFTFLAISIGLVTAVMGLIYSNAGNMRIPVVIYTAAIVIMAYAALSRNRATSRVSFLLVFGGAVLFVLSDSILALNKFGFQVPDAGFLIMATYMLSQFLIIRGLAKHQSQK